MKFRFAVEVDVEIPDEQLLPSLEKYRKHWGDELADPNTIAPVDLLLHAENVQVSLLGGIETADLPVDANYINTYGRLAPGEAEEPLTEKEIRDHLEAEGA